MRVYEAAREFKVEPEKMLQLLRGMGVRATTEASQVDDATIAKLRARMERERRAGHTEVEESLEAVMEEVQTTTTKRRRRKKSDLPEPEAEPEVAAEADETTSPTADAADAIAAEAAEEAAVAMGRKVADIAAAMEALGQRAFVEPETEPEAPAAEAPAEVEAEEEPAAEPVAEVEAAAEAGEVEPPEEAAAAAPTPAPIPERVRPKLRRAAEVLGRTPPRPAASSSPAASAAPGGTVRIQAEGFTPDGRRSQGQAPSSGAPAPAARKPDGKKGKKGKRRVDQDAVQENIARVMSELKTGGKKRRHRHDDREAGRMAASAERKRLAAEEAVIVRVNEFLTVAELAELIDVPANQIIGSAFKNLGLMVTINQRLDFDQIELLLEEFGFRAVREQEYGADMLEAAAVDAPEDLQPRPPIVTVMGHVDHGKTSLLDHIRKTNVIAGEAGGITQHIGAYHVKLQDGRAITFLDTPGHAAFTAMRARGAEVTDIVVLVVAADDSVMPQTIEAISHAKNAGVPIIVAINKVDLPGAEPGKIKQDLLQHEVVVEDFGGSVLAQEVSAKKGTGMLDLLEKILLQAEMLDLRANPVREAQGTVIEAQLDVGKGPVATVLVTHGTLRVGDSFVCGHYDGRVRAMLDERGKTVKEAGPGIPVQVLGMAGVPQAGDNLVAMDAIKAAEIAQTRQRLDREKQLRIKSRGVKLTDISRLLAQGQTATLNLIIKGDVDGSVQALSDSLSQLGTSEVQVDVIHRGVGAINESDVLLATTAGAIVIGFHVRPTGEARAVAVREGVDIRLYSIIYEAVEDVRSALEGMLTPEEKEVLLGVAEVRQIFKVPRIGTVAGCYVQEGVLDRKGRIRLVRDAVQVYEGTLASLKRFKDDAKEVREGFECGLSIEGYNDIKVGDHIECYRVEEVARTLASSAAADA